MQLCIIPNTFQNMYQLTLERSNWRTLALTSLARPAVLSTMSAADWASDLTSPSFVYAWLATRRRPSRVHALERIPDSASSTSDWKILVNFAQNLCKQRKLGWTTGSYLFFLYFTKRFLQAFFSRHVIFFKQKTQGHDIFQVLRFFYLPTNKTTTRRQAKGKSCKISNKNSIHLVWQRQLWHF